jgi:putative endonuclease
MATARQRQAMGAYGETSAARHLTDEQGMTLLDRNWRCTTGEIDLVLRDGDTLVVCEVKTRRGTDFGTPIEAVTPDKFARLRRLASCWLEHHGLRVPEVRIDLVGVDLSRPAAERITHVRGVG